LPTHFGGKQEGGIRPGTEAAPLIAAFGAAVGELPPPHRQMPHYDTLRRHLLARLEGVEGIRFHIPRLGVPYIIHLSVPGLKSETMLHALAQKEIYVSSGSACSKGAKSPVLTAMGLPVAEIDSALRVSLCRDNTTEDIDRFADALLEAMQTLARR
jgi:cysteine desulfurase